METVNQFLPLPGLLGIPSAKIALPAPIERRCSLSPRPGRRPFFGKTICKILIFFNDNSVHQWPKFGRGHRLRGEVAKSRDGAKQKSQAQATGEFGLFKTLWVANIGDIKLRQWRTDPDPFHLISSWNRGEQVA